MLWQFYFYKVWKQKRNFFSDSLPKILAEFLETEAPTVASSDNTFETGIVYPVPVLWIHDDKSGSAFSNHSGSPSCLIPISDPATMLRKKINIHTVIRQQGFPEKQGCEWNDKSANRERESRTRIGSDATFFWDSLSNLVIDDNFRISNHLGLGLAANISAALPNQPDRDREIEII